ncbi:T9SS type A sorting domain-containing protein [Bizionia myxarmorum]|uniref:T9SS type A sorting domain-containing protein n=1 Tax=Bizionia myxarmorum TaxID=291186 RepID=A0A5D0R835_9FLAO|nr:T9SS type A sorting domain-containing protein [Bizionia myxarmorum]TYB77041.1 T9SS type A sorting domain-containing protein [Bizionia myxarmorum]
MKQKLLFLLITVLFTVNNFSQSSFITQDLDCVTGCTDLNVNFPVIQGTNDYEVASIPFNPPRNFNGLENSLFLNVDDLWSNVIDLPFDFNFFGDSYNQLIIGGNGVLSFDVSNAGSSNGWQLNGTLPNSSNETLSEANIFGAAHDMDPSASNGTHEIGYEVFGQAPFRYFIASYYNVGHFGNQCDDLRTTQMMVLYETTNIVEVFLQDKPICALWNSGNAVVGIQNSVGTIAVVPPGRNTSQWEATNEAWRFNPSGPVVENTYQWTNGAGQIIGTTPTVTVCPTSDETFTVETSYFNFSFFGYDTYIEDILVYSGLIGEAPANLQVCSDVTNEFFDLTQQTAVITGGSTCSVVTYYETLANAETGTNEISNPSSYTNTSNPQTIFVRVEDADSGNFETSLFTIQIDLLPATAPAEMEACSTTPGFAEFDLDVLSELITVPNSGFEFSFYASIVDAQNDRNPLVSPFTNTVANSQGLIAKVTDPNTGCFVYTECYVNVLDGADLQNVSLVQCDDEVSDGFTEFDLASVLQQVGNGQPNLELTLYESETDANNSTNPIGNVANYTNTSNPQIIFVRGENLTSGCVGFSTIELLVEEAITLTTPSPLTICDLDGTADGFALFNLTDKDSEILGGLEPNNYAISYYETLADAESNTNALNTTSYTNVIADAQTVFVRVDNLSAGCFATTTLELVVDLDCPFGCQETYTFCYDSNDTTEYVHTSDNGSPLTVVFTAGQVENNFDELIILDSDGITEIYNGYGNSGDVTGLTITSTGDSITIKVLSDGSVSCASGARNPISYYVYCLNFENAIVVNAFIDENGDSIFDDSEVKFNEGLFSYEVNNDGVINYVNSSYGSFIIPNTTVGDTYDVSFVMYENYNECLSQTITLIENVSPIEGETVAVNFPLTRIAECTDIAVSLISYVPPRPGQIQTNYLVVENLGNIPVSGSVEFTHDAQVTFNNVSGLNAGNTITNTSTGFVLNFNNLAPGMAEEVYVGLDVPTSLNIGDFITNSVVYSETDLDISNNSSTLTQAIVNSYDPNDKLESHGPEIKLDDFSNDDYLYYTINFQNLGTAEALEIRVEDVLDSQLDTSTFKMLNASHDYTVTRVDNELTWQFDDINLPSENMDEPNSHGYVYFRIKPLPGYSEGDVIPNTADIYFDFNPAIVTNTFETEFVANLSVEEFASVGYSMYPNPAKTVVNFEFNKKFQSDVTIQVYDVHGKLVLKSKHITQDNKIEINVSKLPQGLYFIELSTSTFKTIEKLIVN